MAGDAETPGRSMGRLDAIVIDVSDLARGAGFWSQLLGVRQVGVDRQYLRLDRQAGGPYVILQKVPEPKVVKNRAHLDFRVPDVPIAQAQVEAIGGRMLGEDLTDGSVVMADPDGNEFCLVSEASGYGAAPTQVE